MSKYALVHDVVYPLSFVRRPAFGSGIGTQPRRTMADSASFLECWNRSIGRGCAGCVRVQGRPQPAYDGHCCAACRDGEELIRKQTESKVESCSLHLYVLLLFHVRLCKLALCMTGPRRVLRGHTSGRRRAPRAPRCAPRHRGATRDHTGEDHGTH